MSKTDKIRELRDLFHEYVNKSSDAILCTAKEDITEAASLSRQLPVLVTEIYNKINELEDNIHGS